jgi:hypothetical protein
MGPKHKLTAQLIRREYFGGVIAQIESDSFK